MRFSGTPVHLDTMCMMSSPVTTTSSSRCSRHPFKICSSSSLVRFSESRSAAAFSKSCALIAASFSARIVSIFFPGYHEREIERDDPFIAQQFRHLASRDFLSQPFDDRGLSNSCFTEQHWVVFGASAEDLNHAFDLVLATDHRIQLAVLRQFSQITAERAQGGRVDIFLSALLPGLSLAFRRSEVRVQFF